MVEVYGQTMIFVPITFFLVIGDSAENNLD